MVNYTKLGFFAGEYKHYLTEKNRLALPKRFRAEIEGNEVVLAKGSDSCIEGFDKTQWKEIVKSHLTISYTEKAGRDLRRRVFASATLVELDSQGRMVLPESLITWAKLEGKIGEPVVIVGVGDHFEIWEESLGKAKLTVKPSDSVDK